MIACKKHSGCAKYKVNLGKNGTIEKTKVPDKTKGGREG